MSLGLDPRAAGLTINGLIIALSAVLVFVLVRAWYSPSVALLASAVYLGFPQVLQSSLEIGPDNALIAAVLGGSVLLRKARHGDISWCLVAGVGAGVGLLVDPRFMVAAAAPLLIMILQRPPARALLLTLGAATVVAGPWHLENWRGGLIVLELGDAWGLWQATPSLLGWGNVPSSFGFGLALLCLPAIVMVVADPRRQREPVLWITLAMAALAILAPVAGPASLLIVALPAFAAVFAAGVLAIRLPRIRAFAIVATVLVIVGHHVVIPWGLGPEPLGTLPQLAGIRALPEQHRRDVWQLRPIVNLTKRGVGRSLSTHVLVAVPGYPVEALRTLASWTPGRSDYRSFPEYEAIAQPGHHHLPHEDWLTADFMILSERHPEARGQDYFLSAVNGALRTYARPFLDAFEPVITRPTPSGRIEIWRRWRPSTPYESTRLLEAAVVIDPDSSDAFRALANAYRLRGDVELATAVERANFALQQLHSGRYTQALQIWTELIARHPRSIFARIAGEDLERLKRL